MIMFLMVNWHRYLMHLDSFHFAFPSSLPLSLSPLSICKKAFSLFLIIFYFCSLNYIYFWFFIEEKPLKAPLRV